MSPRASEFLCEALERSSVVGEDRLTEIFAHLLALDPVSRAALESSLGLTERFDAASITTQLPLISGRRVDLEIQFQGSSGRYVVWIEVKVDAKEQEDQLLDYACELARRYGRDGTVVALAPAHHPILMRAREEHVLVPGLEAEPLAVPLPWQSVANKLEVVGRRRGHGPGWRRGAVATDATADQRLLLEFLTYLERRGLMMNDDPLSLTDGLVASRGRELFDRNTGAITRLLTSAASGMRGFAGIEPEAWHWPSQGDFCSSQGRWWSLPEGSWPTLMSSESAPYADLWFTTSDTEDRPLESRDQAVFVASLTFGSPAPRVVDAFSDSAWRESVSPEIAVVATKSAVRVSKLRYFGELVSAGITLTQQADALADWAERSFDELLTRLPPPSLRES